VTTKNKSEILHGQENRTMPENQIMDISRQDFVNSSIDNKQLYIFAELRNIPHDQTICSQNMMKFEKSLTGVHETLGKVVKTTNRQSDFLKSLA
jgi:hypothetical protein